MIEISVKKNLISSSKSINLDVSLNLKNNTFLAISGKSGSGKTTFLRILAGLESSSGYISVDDEIWQNEQIFLPPQKRKIGFVFQDYALFENFNVEENLLYVKKDRNLADKLLKMTNLTNLKNRKPNTLSGGEKQRVALCRAMMREPRVLLLDEPLSALDPDLRYNLGQEILNLHNEFGINTIMITHEPSEIYRLSSLMIELNDGQISKFGNPKELLLKTSGSQKFAHLGRILELKKSDCIIVAIISIGLQITQVALSKDEAKGLKVGDDVVIGTKAFNLTLQKG